MLIDIGAPNDSDGLTPVTTIVICAEVFAVSASALAFEANANDKETRIVKTVKRVTFCVFKFTSFIY